MVLKAQIASQNIWWKHGTDFEHFDKDLSSLERARLKFQRKTIQFSAGNIYTIRGPRRVGKTVWMKMMILGLLKKQGISPNQVFYFSCDSLPSRSREQLGRVIAFFNEIATEFPVSYIFLDEITYILDWETALKSLVDAGKLARSAVVVSGSSPSQIKKKTEFLPGRGVEGNEYLFKPITFRDFVLTISRNGAALFFTKELEKINSINKLWNVLNNIQFTLYESQREFRKKCNKIYPYIEELNLLFNAYIRTGGFPSVINNYLNNVAAGKKSIDDNIYEETINAILGEISKVGKSEEIARQILNAITRRLGSRYSFSALARDIGEGITHPTLIDYVSVLEDGFIVQLLPSYDFKKGGESIKGDKKIYPIDPIILYALNSKFFGKPGFEMTNELLMNEENEANIIEGMVVTHTARTKEIPKMKEPKSFLSFAYTSQKEVDLLVRRKDDKFLGIEVKYQASLSPREIFQHSAFCWRIVVTRENFDMQGDMIFVPASIFLAGLSTSERNL